MMRLTLSLGVMMALLAATAAGAAEQGARSLLGQNLIQEQNQELPIQIDAATLEVHDKAKTAVFSGDVQVTQGDTTIKCQSLVIFYGPERPAGAGASSGAGAGPAANSPAASPVVSAATPGAKPSMPQGSQDIRRIEARGGVTVITKEQNASGDLGVYDLKKKTITLTGNVVVSQGKNVLHGERVVVDVASGNAHFDSTGSTAQTRVRALIQPGKGVNGGASSTTLVPLATPKAN